MSSTITPDAPTTEHFGIACPLDGARGNKVRAWVEAHHAAVTEAANLGIDELPFLLDEFADGGEVEVTTCVEHYKFSGPFVARGPFGWEKYDGPLARLSREDFRRWAFDGWLTKPDGDRRWAPGLIVPTAASIDYEAQVLGLASGLAGGAVYLRVV